jgi:hypothetical protein
VHNIHLHTLLHPSTLANAKKLFKLLFVLRNVFPVEWGIFAFSSIIIVTNNSQNAFGSQMCFGRGRLQAFIVVPPPSLEPWRVEVALLVEGAPRH